MFALVILCVLGAFCIRFIPHSYRKTREANEAALRQRFDSDAGKNDEARKLMRDAGYGV